jgi:hypothetical protein
VALDQFFDRFQPLHWFVENKSENVDDALTEKSSFILVLQLRSL